MEKYREGQKLHCVFVDLEMDYVRSGREVYDGSEAHA